MIVYLTGNTSFNKKFPQKVRYSASLSQQRVLVQIIVKKSNISVKLSTF